MCQVPIEQFFNSMEFSRSLRLFKKEHSHRKYAYRILCRFHCSKPDGDQLKGKNDYDKPEKNLTSCDRGIRKSNSPGDDLSSDNSKRKPEIDWLSKALESALQLCKWAVPTDSKLRFSG